MNNLLVISTLPHYLVLLVSPSPLYSIIVFFSSTLSVLWHYSDSNASSYLGLLDHLLAFVWLMADYEYFRGTSLFGTMLIINGLTFLTNMFVSFLDTNKFIPYHAGHSCWHLVSATKSIYLAYQLKIM